MMIFCQTNTVTQLKNLNQNADEILGSVTSALRNRLRLLRQTKTSTEALYSSPRELLVQNKPLVFLSLVVNEKVRIKCGKTLL